MLEWWPAGILENHSESELVNLLKLFFRSFKTLDHRFEFYGDLNDLPELSKFVMKNYGQNAHANIVVC
jgi:hypothetical protein